MYIDLLDPETSSPLYLASMYNLLADMGWKACVSSPSRMLVRPSLYFLFEIPLLFAGVLGPNEAVCIRAVGMGGDDVFVSVHMCTHTRVQVQASHHHFKLCKKMAAAAGVSTRDVACIEMQHTMATLAFLYYYYHTDSRDVLARLSEADSSWKEKVSTFDHDPFPMSLSLAVVCMQDALQSGGWSGTNTKNMYIHSFRSSCENDDIFLCLPDFLFSFTLAAFVCAHRIHVHTVSDLLCPSSP